MRFQLPSAAFWGRGAPTPRLRVWLVGACRVYFVELGGGGKEYVLDCR